MENIVDLTMQAFEPGGAVETVFRRYGRKVIASPHQRDYSIAVSEAIEAGDPVLPPLALYEASTGIGKTLGYLIPLALHASSGHRSIVSASTNQLLDQILSPGGDFDLAASIAAEVTGLPRVTAAARKGRNNFIDRRGIEELLKQGFGSGNGKIRNVLDNLSIWIDKTATGDLEEFQQEYGALPDEIPLSFITARRFKESEFYDRHVTESRVADIIVTNHALLLIQAKLQSANLLGEKGNFHTLIVDEADRLPAAAESIFTDGFPVRLVRSIAEDIPASERRNLVIQTLDRIADLMHATHDFARAGEYGDLFMEKDNGGYLVLAGSSTRAVRDGIVHLTKGLDVEIERLALEARDLKVAERLLTEVASLKAVAWSLQRECEDQDLPVTIMKYSPVREYPSLASLPVYPAHKAARLWTVFGLPHGEEEEGENEPFVRSVVFTSASLGVPSGNNANDDLKNSFISFAAQIGITKRMDGRFMRRFTPSRFGTAAFTLADPAVPGPTKKTGLIATDEDEDYTDPEWARYAADMVNEACRQEKPFVLVLTPSFKDAGLIGDYLLDDGVAEVLVHRQGVKLRQMIEEFIAAGRGVLVTPAAWEGVNIHGLTDVVIARIPMAPPNSLHSIVRHRVLTAKGFPEERAKGIILNHNRNEAIRKTHQGLARGIRQADQHVKLWIADPRFPLPASRTRNVFAGYHQYGNATPPRADAGGCGFYKPGWFFKEMVNAIPVRFREGAVNPWGQAKIFNNPRKDVQPPAKKQKRGVK